MKTSPRNKLLLFLAVHGLATQIGVAAAQETPARDSRAAQILAKLVPLPRDIPRTILNPYHADPAWKLWAIDPTPVTLDQPHFKGSARNNLDF